MDNFTHNEQVNALSVKPISRRSARQLVLTHHYMQTFPAGARLSLGVFFEKRCVGVLVFGFSASTDEKVARLVPSLRRENYLEMQRMWISDSMGHNTESKTLSLAIRCIKQNAPAIKLIYTHAGGCKNDCGIVYQASAWLYFGRKKCDDFYLTEEGQYKNIVAELRFGRVKANGKSKQQIGEEAFGAGTIVDSWRYVYVYPIDRGLRRKLTPLAVPYPKESDHFRYAQEFVS